MKIIELNGNLFDTPIRYLMHCISKDYAMGKGIAVEMSRRYNLHDSLRHIHSNVGDCVLTGKVFNLITKSKYWNKPTYETLKQSLLSMKKLMIDNNITEVAGPKIGCGLDKLSWGPVKEVVEEVFGDTNITIVIYTYNPNSKRISYV